MSNQEFKFGRAVSSENVNQFDTIDLDDIFSGMRFNFQTILYYNFFDIVFEYIFLVMLVLFI